MRKIEAIHAAAAQRFATHGYHATRMADIAAELDMQAGSLYYYFASKEELLVAVVESRVGRAVDELEAVVAGEGSASDRVREAIGHHLRAFNDDADIYSIFNFERLEGISAELADKVNDPGRRYEALWGELLESGKARGEFRSDLDVRVSVKAIVGLCNSTLVWHRPDGRHPIDTIAAQYADLVIGGIRS